MSCQAGDKKQVYQVIQAVVFLSPIGKELTKSLRKSDLSIQKRSPAELPGLWWSTIPGSAGGCC